MDQEVIPIGGSSKEETRHEASDSKSSSLERLRSHVVLVEEPLASIGWHNLLLLLWTGNLFQSRRFPPPPISISRGARRSSGKNIRASPRVHHSHNIGPPSYFLLVVGYEWVRDDVLKYQSSITSVASVATPEH